MIQRFICSFIFRVYSIARGRKQVEHWLCSVISVFYAGGCVLITATTKYTSIHYARGLKRFLKDDGGGSQEKFGTPSES